MANEFQTTFNGTPPVTLVGLLQNRNGQFYNTGTMAFEAYNAANIANYAAVSFAQISSTSEYLGSMPANIPAGKYRMTSYIQAGASLATTDIVAASAYGSATIEWKGTAELSTAADINVTVLANNTAISAVSGVVGSTNTAVGGLANGIGSNSSAIASVGSAVAGVGSQTGYIGGLVTSVGSISTALAGVSTAVAGVPLATVADMKADAVLGATFNRSKGKFTFAGSTLTLLADDGTTVIGTVNITQSAGTITSRV